MIKNREKNKKIILFLFLGLLFISCNKQYSLINDKRFIKNPDIIKNEWKFELVVYYNNENTCFDAPLELGQIRDGYYEKKISQVFYERSFDNFIKEVFKESPIKINDKQLLVNTKNSISSVCDIYDRKGELIFWYSYKENSDYMLLNGILIKKNDILSEYTKYLIDKSIILP